MTGELTDREITRVVNRYIGVSGGYLGDFSYPTHADFYPEYCDLEIDPYAIDGRPASVSSPSSPHSRPEFWPRFSEA